MWIPTALTCKSDWIVVIGAVDKIQIGSLVLRFPADVHD